MIPPSLYRYVIIIIHTPTTTIFLFINYFLFYSPTSTFPCPVQKCSPEIIRFVCIPFTFHGSSFLRLINFGIIIFVPIAFGTYPSKTPDL